jgi:hypothetical protein
MRWIAVALAGAAWLMGACGVGCGGSKRSEFETMQTIVLVRSAIEGYQSDLKRLPPDTTAAFVGTRWEGLAIPGNTTNEGNECLLVALRHPDLRTPLDQLPGKNPLGNTDKDAWSRAPYERGTADAQEILDAYGNPIAYITAARYAQTLRVVRGDGKTVEVRAVKRPNGAFYNPKAFQLISLGKDGRQDEGERLDDIENFTRDPE